MAQKQATIMSYLMTGSRDRGKKKRHIMLVIVFVAGFFAINGTGIANAADGYVGLGYGNTWSTIAKDSLGFGTEDITPSKAIWRIFGGFQCHRYFGIEGGYIHLGNGRATDDAGDYYEAKVTGFEITPVGFLPLGRHFTVVARAGLTFWSSNITAHSTMDGTSTKDESGTSLVLGIGAEYDFNRLFGLRGEYARYAVDKAKAGSGNFNTISINGVFFFYRP